MNKYHSIIFLLTLILETFVTGHLFAQDAPKVWYVKSGASGDGHSIESPLGTCYEIDTQTRPGDIIVVLASDIPLDGGTSLKNDQQVIGVSENGIKPVITNTDSTRNGGNGILLANGCRVKNITIENTFSSGMLGINCTDVWIDNVDVLNANRSGAYTEAEMKVLGRLPMGGIIFVASGADISGSNQVNHSKIINARGFGITTFAFQGAKADLVVSSTDVKDGTPVSRFDWGVAVIAEGPSTKIDLDISDTKIGGRMSRGGRNVVILTNSDADINARIRRSHLDEVGQDGILATAWIIPAKIDLEVRDCIIEKAYQTNIEGAINNLPPFDSLRIDENRVSITIINSTIRDAGAVKEFMDDGGNGNIWLGATGFAQRIDPNSKAPYAPGNFYLTMRNSRVEGASDFGIGFGNWFFDLEPEKSIYNVQLHENTIRNNGGAEIEIAAPNARIDARQNYWGTADGLSRDRISLKNGAKYSQLDASHPMICKDE